MENQQSPLRVRRVQGEKVLYGRNNSPEPDYPQSHAHLGDRHVYYNLNDPTYNPKRNLGVKGKEILAHELGHLKDKKNYSNYPLSKMYRGQEIRADVHMAKSTDMGRKDYGRVRQHYHNDAMKELMRSPEYKQLDIIQKIDAKEPAMRASPHKQARDDLYNKWDRYKRLGLKESYIGYLLNLNTRRLSCKG